MEIPENEAGNFLPAEPEKIDRLAEVFDWLESFLFVLAPLMLAMLLLVRPAVVDGSSMVPTLHDGERLILQVAGYKEPKYGDIVVIDRTQDESEPIVKRVIGKEGDVIYIDFEKYEVWRNDTKLDEAYINEPTELSYDIEFPVRVPLGSVFVMGDNRNHSLDSRSSDIGMVDMRRIMGKAFFRFFPFQNVGGIE